VAYKHRKEQEFLVTKYPNGGRLAEAPVGTRPMVVWLSNESLSIAFTVQIVEHRAVCVCSRTLAASLSVTSCFTSIATAMDVLASHAAPLPEPGGHVKHWLLGLPVCKRNNPPLSSSISARFLDLDSFWLDVVTERKAETPYNIDLCISLLL